MNIIPIGKMKSRYITRKNEIKVHYKLECYRILNREINLADLKFKMHTPGMSVTFPCIW